MAKAKQPFEARGEFVVARGFRYNGIDHPRGSGFPWRRMAIGERSLHKLFNDGFLAMKASGKVTAAPKEQVVAKKVIMFYPAKYEVRIGMRGPAEVLDGDVMLLRVSRKEGKRLAAAQMVTPINLDELVV